MPRTAVRTHPGVEAVAVPRTRRILERLLSIIPPETDRDVDSESSDVAICVQWDQAQEPSRY